MSRAPPLVPPVAAAATRLGDPTPGPVPASPASPALRATADEAVPPLIPGATVPRLIGAGAALHIVANPGAGGGTAGQALRQSIESHPVLSRHPLQWHVPGRGEALDALAARAAQQAAAGGGVVVAAGGDGTINTVAQAAWRANAAMGVLPQGTFNYFGREHGLPLETAAGLDTLADALGRANLLPVRVGLINDRVFLVNASIGLYPRLLVEREAAKSRFGRYRWVALLAALKTLLRPARPLRLSLRDHPPTARERAWEVSTLFVGANALQLDEVGLPQADAVRQGRLAVVMLAAQDRWGTLRLLWRAWRGRLVEDGAVVSTALDGLDVTAVGRRAGRRLRVACDGETATMASPLRIRVGDRPLWLLAPARTVRDDEAAGDAAAATDLLDLALPAGLRPALP